MTIQDQVRGLVVSIGVPSQAEALTIGRTLVAERLAAAANVLPGVTSIYWWDGAVQERGETTLILKTLPENFDRLQRRVRDLHSYVTPGTIAWRLAAADGGWLDWLATEAGSDEAPPA